MFFRNLLLAAAIVLGPANADNDTSRVLESKIAPGATISYKQTHICETTPGVRSFSGYIHLPHSLLSNAEGATAYNASVFFWYFESRKNPRDAPLAMFFGGGPGTTSLNGALIENGPCYVNKDSNSTVLNEWSWNNNVNMLYIDQPVQIGFSYDTLIRGTLDLLTDTITPNGTSNSTFVVPGTFASQNLESVVNTTANAARVIWPFTQLFLQEFPEHKSCDDRVSVWAESYGGHWAPEIVSHFLSQNAALAAGTLDSPLRKAKHINVDTLGINNGCIDSKIEGSFYPEMAFNNTYDLQAIPEEVYLESKINITKEGGCNELTDICRELAAYDPGNTGTNETINAACAAATLYCFQFVQGAYVAVSNRNPFDIARGLPSASPDPYMTGFLNQQWVQKELGVPLNFSISAAHIVNTFFAITGDPIRVTIDTINKVASSGVKVALVFGDRDYRCNWMGGEAVSLAMEYPSNAAFRSAGYAPLIANSSYEGGVVRQHNKVSFSRVFQAGHAVGSFQPETVSKIFDRVMFDKDVATGEIDIVKNGTYSTNGPSSSFAIKDVLPPSPEIECYVWDAVNTCTPEQRNALENGTAIVEDFILTGIRA